jgi:hypothetical protein
MRAKTFRILGWLFVGGCASFLLALALEGEWHAARGHELFHQKRFGEAGHHLAKVTDRTTLYGWMRRAEFRRHQAQAFLASGRKPEALEHYAILAERNPGDATSHVLVALRDWDRGLRSEAAYRLGKIVAQGPACGVCAATHDKFTAAVLAQSTLGRAQTTKESALRDIVLPTQCLCYKAVVVAGRMAAGELVRRVGGILDSAINPGWLASKGVQRVTEQAAAVVRGLLRDAVQKAIEAAVQEISEFQSKCRRPTEISDLPYLKEIEWTRQLEGWIDHLPYVSDTKQLVAAGQELHAVIAIALDFTLAHLDETNAHAEMAAATDQAKATWEGIAQMAASKPGFEITDVRSKAEPPPARSWYEWVRWPW